MRSSAIENVILEQEDAPTSVRKKYIYLRADANSFSKCQNSTKSWSNYTFSWQFLYTLVYSEAIIIHDFYYQVFAVGS
jgi:hypothetical protein